MGTTYRTDPEKAWLRLLPDADYRMPMNLRPGNPAGFWSHSPDAEQVLMERRRWLDSDEERHHLWMPESDEALREALVWLGGVTGSVWSSATGAACGLEPDWVLLSGDPSRGFPILGGAVCFPSGWGLEEKLGRPLAEVHAPVPGLEESLGASIATFLSRLAPGASWERDNWGLSADPSLNHHPSLAVRRLDEGACLADAWLRLEEQFLTRLPATGAVLFGIRVSSHRLSELVADLPALVPRIARALETMPDALARYKGVDGARAGLARQLRALS